jgi:hypothetical protein
MQYGSLTASKIIHGRSEAESHQVAELPHTWIQVFLSYGVKTFTSMDYTLTMLLSLEKTSTRAWQIHTLNAVMFCSTLPERLSEDARSFQKDLVKVTSISMSVLFGRRQGLTTAI